MTHTDREVSFVENTGLLKRLKKCTTLPTPSGVAARIIELGEDPTVDIGAVADAVSVDPALSTKILRIANSSLYARQRKSENLRQAIMMFGINGTLNIALSFSLVNNLRSDRKSDLDHNLFWRRSVAAATCCKFVASALKFDMLEEYFLAGLIQDIGMIALDKAVPDFYQDLQRRQEDHESLVQFEIEKIGTDHAAIGAWLLQTWKFPTRLLNTVSGSHDPTSIEVNEEELQLTQCVALSSKMADIWCLDNNEKAIEDAFNKAANLLKIDRTLFLEIINSANNEIKAMFRLFEINLNDQSDLEFIQEQAKEILGLITLKNMQEAEGLRKTVASLESRTRDLEENTRRDGLTGLYNRNYLDHVLVREFETAKKHSWPLSVAFIDLDFFKKINDNYGHQAGDRVLEKAASLFQENTRDTDIVARYGGEEFVIVLVGTGPEGGRIICDRLVKAFRNTRHTLGKKEELIVTISVGFASLGEGIMFDSPQNFLKASDQCVYRAKSMGRNRYVEYNSSTH